MPAPKFNVGNTVAMISPEPGYEGLGRVTRLDTVQINGETAYYRYHVSWFDGPPAPRHYLAGELALVPACEVEKIVGDDG